jgi:hypothetical protein
MLMPLTRRRFPVGGTPRNVPSCVPSAVKRTRTLSPSRPLRHTALIATPLTDVQALAEERSGSAMVDLGERHVAQIVQHTARNSSPWPSSRRRLSSNKGPASA